MIKLSFPFIALLIMNPLLQKTSGLFSYEEDMHFLVHLEFRSLSIKLLFKTRLLCFNMIKRTNHWASFMPLMYVCLFIIGEAIIRTLGHMYFTAASAISRDHVRVFSDFSVVSQVSKPKKLIRIAY